MTDSDIVNLIFTGDSVQLVRLSNAADPGALTPCGRGWSQEMSRGKAERVVASRPDFFVIEELSK